MSKEKKKSVRSQPVISYRHDEFSDVHEVVATGGLLPLGYLLLAREESREKAFAKADKAMKVLCKGLKRERKDFKEV